MTLLELFKGFPERWTKGTFAKTAMSEPCSATDPAACRWCVEGALYKCFPRGEPSNEEAYLKAAERLRLAAKARGFDSSIDFNDDPATTFDDFISMLEEAGV